MPDISERQQRAAIELAKGDKTYGQVAKAVGVAERTLYNWRETESFQNAVKQATDRLFASARPRILAALERAAIDGDVPAIRVALQVLGDLGDGSTNVNVQQGAFTMVDRTEKPAQKPETEEDRAIINRLERLGGRNGNGNGRG